MAAKIGLLEHWRNFFRNANSDIFEVIDNAIIVAASDCRQEFLLRRDGIAERLFSCRLTRCLGCDRVELAIPEEEHDRLKGDFRGDAGTATVGSTAKESKPHSSTDDRDGIHKFSNYSYNEAEALTYEIEEKSLTVADVHRIKDILQNHDDESDEILFESLRRLQLMDLSVGILKITEIGKAVNGMRKHKSKQIRHLARTLINEWKNMVDEWVTAANAIAGNNTNSGGSPDSVNPSCCLPSPPLDEGVFLATQPTSMELSQFFDGMDDVENDDEHGRKPTLENDITNREPKNSLEGNEGNGDHNYLRKKEPKSKQIKPSCADAGPRGTLKMKTENRPIDDDARLRPLLKWDNIQKKPLNGSQNKQLSDEEASVQVKLEATKRKLQAGYQQAQNAKKQRTIQVMEWHDLPEQGFVHKNVPQKWGSDNKHFSYRGR